LPEPMIEMEGVSMRFNLARERTDTIKEYIFKLLKGKLHYSEFWALRDVSFTLSAGESLAVIGRNGSGKSTLLKVIAGVMTQTAGSLKVWGNIAPLIELGAGFDPDLTARENIFLNGAIMGFSRKFMQGRFDEIVDFSELEEFLDVPVKNFSSGMVARLGFSVATIVEADILIVDEILAVGDVSFQQKCEKRMEKLLGGNTTLVFVSHAGEQVKRLCKRAIWLEHGAVAMAGNSAMVYDAYQAFMEHRQ
jgi:ABC-type polysaccharide/polyol phosphate transport system ATPase subunit